MMTVDELAREIAALSPEDRRRLLGQVFLMDQRADYLATLAKRLSEPRPGPNWVPLAEVERRLGQPGLIDLFGTIDYDADFDYKANRWRRRHDAD